MHLVLQGSVGLGTVSALLPLVGEGGTQSYQTELNVHLKHTNAVRSTTKIREKCLSTWEGLLTDASTNSTISQACFRLM